MLPFLPPGWEVGLGGWWGGDKFQQLSWLTLSLFPGTLEGERQRCETQHTLWRQLHSRGAP